MSAQEKEVKVNLGERSYPIRIGHNILTDGLKGDFGKRLGREVFLISDKNVFENHGTDLIESLSAEGRRTNVYVMPPGEHAKSWEQAGEILTRMLGCNLERDSAVIAFGGGVVGDMAGFVAALYQRGVRFYQLPTTLLAQVDSSIGGKVAVNHVLGKNMIGTFYQPQEVWADFKYLDTLPTPEWKSGLAEVIKYAIIRDEKLFCFIEKQVDSLLRHDRQSWLATIENCCLIKAEIVADDEKDKGSRNILNYGHTIGHALESATEYKKYRHGEAVAVGMAAAARIALELQLLKENTVSRIENLFSAFDLPKKIPEKYLEKTLDNLIYDKKIVGGELVFVLPVSIGEVIIKRGIPTSLIKEILRTMSE